MEIDRRFDRFVAAGDPPTFVVSVHQGVRDDACLVGFATQCSIEPRRFAVCLSTENRTWRVVAEHPAVLAVHRLHHDDAEAAAWFGGTTGDDGDPFGPWTTSPGPEGVPLIDALPDRFVGRETTRHRVGDHVLIVLDPIDVHGTGDGKPFTINEAAPIQPGHPPGSET